MSEFGVIIGEDGNIILDTNKMVLGIIQSGIITMWGQSTQNVEAKYYYQIDSTETIGAIAIKPTPSGYSLVEWKRIHNTTQDPIEYIVYGPNVNSDRPIPQYGLVTYDADGNVVYNSNNKYMKIAEIIDIPYEIISQYNFSAITINHGTQNPFYLIPDNQYLIPFPVGSGTGGIAFIFIGIKKLSATSISLKRVLVGHTGPLFGPPGPDPVVNVPNPFRIALCVP